MRKTGLKLKQQNWRRMKEIGKEIAWLEVEEKRRGMKSSNQRKGGMSSYIEEIITVARLGRQEEKIKNRTHVEILEKEEQLMLSLNETIIVNEVNWIETTKIKKKFEKLIKEFVNEGNRSPGQKCRRQQESEKGGLKKQQEVEEKSENACKYDKDNQTVQHEQNYLQIVFSFRDVKYTFFFTSPTNC